MRGAGSSDSPWRLRARPLAVSLALAALPPAALAQGSNHCRLALLLGLDVSASVDAREYALQRDGLATALQAPDVRDAFFSTPGTVALAVYEWSGRHQQSVILDWMRVDTPDMLTRAATVISTAQRGFSGYPTAVGYALGYATAMLARAPTCDRQVVDISGDGINNEGFRPGLAYDNFPFDGVTVNGLAILGADPSVRAFYADELRHGPGAFVIEAQGFADFQRAMALKLYREVNALQLGEARAPATGNDG